MLVTQLCLTFCDPMEPASSSVHGFSRQEYWSGLPFLVQGIFPAQGLNLGLLHCRQILYHLSHQRNIFYNIGIYNIYIMFMLHMMWCREPPWEIPPMTKVMRERPDRQKQIRTRGIPWTCLNIYPKTKICLLFTILCLSTTLLILAGGYPQPPFSGENQLKALSW